jgi:hypothetical protein
MTNKQSSDLTDFIEQARENSLDSLDFTQMSFTIEEVVGGDGNYSHPLLDELGACLRASYPDKRFHNDSHFTTEQGKTIVFTGNHTTIEE